MRALAEYLLDGGWTLTGSDLDTQTPGLRALAERGVGLASGHNRDHLSEETDLVIHSAAVPSTNPERSAARDRNLPDLSYVDLLELLCRDREAIGIAGTHGKSTTTALCSWILESSGADPGYLCGAELVGKRRGGRAGAGPYLVVECCEFRRHFLKIPVRTAAILSVEPDHFDCYGSLAETVDAFAAFAQNLPADGLLLWNAACAGAARRSPEQPAGRRALRSVPRPTGLWRMLPVPVGRPDSRLFITGRSSRMSGCRCRADTMSRTRWRRQSCA